MEIQRKRAVVTGGGSGLGRALCLEFARRGAAVAVADIQPERARETLELVLDAPQADASRSFTVTCDVGKEEGFLELAELVAERWSGLDILVNNAGIAAVGTVDETSETDWNHMLNINLMGVVRGCRTFVPMLKAQQSGHIANVASFAGLACGPGMASYNVAKAGVIALSETLRGELASSGITVSVACPSFFVSNLLELSDAPPQVKDRVEHVMRSSPVQAQHVAEDMIDAIVKGRFMVITHRKARRAHLLKRLMPERFFREIQKQIGGFRAGQREN